MDGSIFQWMESPDNDKLLVLMRGVPAAGKSFRAQELSNGDPDVICSADHYFGATPEEYVANWSIEKLGCAHNLCKKNVRIRMQRQRKLVIVDNTNTMVREMMPYFDMAVQYQYKVKIAEPTSPWWVNDIAPYLSDKDGNRKQLERMCQLLWEKNQLTHKVPLASIKKMLWRYHVDVTVKQLQNIYERQSMSPINPKIATEAVNKARDWAESKFRLLTSRKLNGEEQRQLIELAGIISLDNGAVVNLTLKPNAEPMIHQLERIASMDVVLQIN